MKQTKLIMGMPISVEIVGSEVDHKIFKEVFDYFRYVDGKYSTYKPDSEISLINAGLPKKSWSHEMKMILRMCEQTKRQTNGYFDIVRGGQRDPSGLVKGWAIQNAASILAKHGYRNFYIDAGGDIQVSGKNAKGKPWQVGIRNPFNRDEIIKKITLSTEGVATSGTYVRGQHIYNPLKPKEAIKDIVAITVIGPDIYNADRFATAAYAMGKKGIEFIEKLKDYEGYMINKDKTATMTSGFGGYVSRQT
ncbi:FAD:protein FMN transferase [Candidatus Saccharibacteria bacterium]|nr:FAD:protein FMN transferase [Candidatus Saccharibacteria bacterium]